MAQLMIPTSNSTRKLPFLSDRKRTDSEWKFDENMMASTDSKEKYLSLLKKVATNQNNHNTFYAELIRKNQLPLRSSDSVVKNDAKMSNLTLPLQTSTHNQS
jgi:hypothetical protein